MTDGNEVEAPIEGGVGGETRRLLAEAVQDRQNAAVPKITAQTSFAGINLEKYSILTTKVFEGTRVSIFATKAMTEAYCLIENPSKKISAEDVIKVIKSARVPVSDGLARELQDYIDSGAKVDGIRGSLLIAKGQPPQHGEDSKVEWHVPEPADHGAGKTNEADQVDYRERRSYTFCETGTNILTVHPPTKGTPGSDIRGTVLPATDGEWHRPLAGKNVTAEENQRKMYAAIDGVVRFDGQRVFMAKMLQLPAVDFNSGNVAYDGDVQVDGDVKEGFEVNSKHGNVAIGGDVRDAKIHGEKVFVTGGVFSSHLISEGMARLQIVENSRVEANGDVLANKDVVSTQIDCGGKLKMLTSKLVGGRINALGGIQAKWIGGKDGSSTTIAISPENCRLPVVNPARERLQSLQEAITKIATPLAPIRGPNQEKILASMPQEKRDAIRKLLSKLSSLEFERDVSQSELSRAIKPFLGPVKANVFANSGISAGVKVTIGEVSWVCPEEMKGPHKIGLNHDGDAIVCEPAEAIRPGQGEETDA